MKKIPTIFLRGEDHRVIDKWHTDCHWVRDGQGTATIKIDGTCCLVRDGKLFKRRELKAKQSAPANFEPASDADPITKKIVGWVPVGDGPEDKWHREAFSNDFFDSKVDGTYELIGPKIQGGLYGTSGHLLVRHGKQKSRVECPRTYVELKTFLMDIKPQIEGIVWHHADGRMAKIKVRDFGKKRWWA